MLWLDSEHTVADSTSTERTPNASLAVSPVSPPIEAHWTISLDRMNSNWNLGNWAFVIFITTEKLV